MSGYTNASVFKFETGQPMARVNDIFTEGLYSYFGEESRKLTLQRKPPYEEGMSEQADLYFFINEGDDEDLVSFILNYDEHNGLVQYFSLIDNSKFTASLFYDDRFASSVIDAFRSNGVKSDIRWSTDGMYNEMKDLFSDDKGVHVGKIIKI